MHKWRIYKLSNNWVCSRSTLSHDYLAYNMMPYVAIFSVYCATWEEAIKFLNESMKMSYV